MNNISEIRHHIQAVTDTGKITGAMYLISSAKMRRALAACAQLEAYQAQLLSNLRLVQGQIDGAGHPLFEANRTGRPVHLVVAGDKGLCGSYNADVLRRAGAQLTQSENPLVFPIGHVAKETLGAKYDCDDAFVYFIHEPELHHGRLVMQRLLPMYLNGEISRADITCTVSKRRGVQEPVTVQLLPICLPVQQTQGDPDRWITLPDGKTLLDSVCWHYMVFQVYSCLAGAFACEQYARMTAMEAAKDNAQQMLAKLKLELNHARQAQITSEITEIVAGRSE